MVMDEGLAGAKAVLAGCRETVLRSLFINSKLTPYPRSGSGVGWIMRTGRSFTMLSGGNRRDVNPGFRESPQGMGLQMMGHLL